MEEDRKLIDTIVKGVQERKGQDIIIADLRQTEGAIANYFVICQGNSPTQVEAIADSIDETVRRDMHQKPLNVVGLGLAQWVAMDYEDVLVHIFLPEAREFYNLEGLWEDCSLTNIPNID